MYTIYGIPNCNSVKKARTWLSDHHIEYHFHDYKKEGVAKAKLAAWCKQLGWENVLNKKGTTWRDLDDTTKAEINTQEKAINFMLEHTSSIKRPIIEKDGKFVVMRFDETEYESLFV